MVRVTRTNGSIFVINIPKLLTYFAQYLNEEAYFKHWIAWNEMASPLGRTLLPNHCGILWYVKSKEPKFFDLRRPHSRCRICKELLHDYGGKKDLIHPFGTLVSDVWTDIINALVWVFLSLFIRFFVRLFSLGLFTRLHVCVLFSPFLPFSFFLLERSAFRLCGFSEGVLSFE